MSLFRDAKGKFQKIWKRFRWNMNSRDDVSKAVALAMQELEKPPLFGPEGRRRLSLPDLRRISDIVHQPLHKSFRLF